MTEAQGFRTDEDLFALARKVLSDAGFAQKEVKLQDVAVLLAENAYCIVALAATPTVDDLIAAEPQVEALLHTSVERVGIGPKLWDAYVVLLTQERPSDQRGGLRPLFNINYDTRGFRRMARVGVDANYPRSTQRPHPFRGASEIGGSRACHGPTGGSGRLRSSLTELTNQWLVELSKSIGKEGDSVMRSEFRLKSLTVEAFRGFSDAGCVRP